tara:strand:- start:7503 stop:7853 length:351 start_codon:yes stop_codon:yes gene_type:complete
MYNFFVLSKEYSKNKGIKYIFCNLFLTFLFAILYWLSDKFIEHFPDFSKKNGLGTIKSIDSFYSYLYYSLITQTTVGYSGILPDGGNVRSSNSNLIKITNIFQLLSIVIITGFALM